MFLYRTYAQVYDFSREGKRTPYNQVHEVFVLADVLAKDEISEPNMDWVPGSLKMEVTMRGHKLALEDIRRMTADLLEKAQRILVTDVLRGYQPLDEKIMEKLVDCLCEDDPGYSFLTERKNDRLLNSYKTALGEHLIRELASRDPQRTFLLIHPLTGRRQWNKAELSLWAEKVAEFVNALLVLVHLTSGQPARATELREYMLTNSRSGLRNVFICQDTFMIVQQYSKTSSLTGHDSAIARFLPKPVAKLLLNYLCLVKPFER